MVNTIRLQCLETSKSWVLATTPIRWQVFSKQSDSAEWSLQIINRTGPEPIKRMVEDLFGNLSTQVSETTREEADTDLVVLLRDGEVVGSSSLSTLRDTLLLVNSDYYRTGAADLGNLDVPDVILELSDTVFTLRGYPDSNNEKLVLTSSLGISNNAHGNTKRALCAPRFSRSLCCITSGLHARSIASSVRYPTSLSTCMAFRTVSLPNCPVSRCMKPPTTRSNSTGSSSTVPKVRPALRCLQDRPVRPSGGGSGRSIRKGSGPLINTSSERSNKGDEPSVSGSEVPSLDRGCVKLTVGRSLVSQGF